MIRIDTPEQARRWVEVYVDGEPPSEGIDGPGLIPAGREADAQTPTAMHARSPLGSHRQRLPLTQSAIESGSFPRAVDLGKEVATSQQPGDLWAEDHAGRGTPGGGERAIGMDERAPETH